MQLILIETDTNINPKIPRSIKIDSTGASVFILTGKYSSVFGIHIYQIAHERNNEARHRLCLMHARQFSL
jgi:hypothetical protein